MLWVQDWKSPTSAFDAEKLLKMQLGAVSPMWLAFAGVATVGAAMWSASHWMRLASGGAYPLAQPDGLAKPAPTAEAQAPVAIAPVDPEVVVASVSALAAAAPRVKAPKAKAPSPVGFEPGKAVAKIDGRTKAARTAKAARTVDAAIVKAAQSSGKRRAKGRSVR